MASRLELLKSSIAKNAIDAVFLRNKTTAEMGGDDPLREPYRKSDLCYICISTTAKAISQVPIITSKVVNTNTGDTKPLPFSDPRQRIWHRPNYITDRYTFKEAIVTFLFHDGEAFILPFPPGLSPPDSIWVIRKNYIRPMKDPRTGNLIGWWYNPRGHFNSDGVGNQTPGTIPIGIDEIAHIYFFNPYDPFSGFAPLEAGRLNIIVDYRAATYTSNFFENGAVPGGMLYTEQKLSDKQFLRAKEQFQAQHGGYRNAYRLAVLEQGLKYTQTGLTQKDMELGDLRGLTAERIYQIFGMKKAVISVIEDVNYATSREEKKEWWEGTNIPIMNMIASALSFTLYPKGDCIISFDITTVAALKEALKDKTETGYKLWQMGFTANEINHRLELGFDDRPWRGVGYMAVNIIPVDQVGIETSLNPPKSLVSGSDILMSENKEDDRNQHIWDGLIRQMTPLEIQFGKKVSRVFFDMRKKTLELLFRQPKTPKDLDDELFSQESLDISKYTDPIYQNSLMLGVATIGEEIGVGISFGLSDPEAIAFLSNKTLKIKNIIQTIKDQIHSELIQGYEKGESIDQIADRIRNVFDMAKSRASTIARTEVSGSVQEGRSIAINRSGFKEKTWFTAMDERVREQHRLMHGKTIKVGEIWVMPDGTSLRHPSDYSGPAHQVINCRCIEVVKAGSHYLEGN